MRRGGWFNQRRRWVWRRPNHNEAGAGSWNPADSLIQLGRGNTHSSKRHKKLIGNWNHPRNCQPLLRRLNRRSNRKYNNRFDRRSLCHSNSQCQLSQRYRPDSRRHHSHNNWKRTLSALRKQRQARYRRLAGRQEKCRRRRRRRSRYSAHSWRLRQQSRQIGRAHV